MKNLAQASVVLVALLGASAALAVAAVGCGGDDTSVGGGDAQSDVTVDQTSSDAKPDHKGDAMEKDAKDKDVADNDAGEASTGDDAPDDVEVTDADTAALLAFPNTVNTAFCLRQAQCCGFDGGAGFNVARCVADTVGPGGGFANTLSAAQVDSGHILLDKASAAACLSDIAKLNCDTLSNTPTPLWTNTRTSCATALQGQVGVNEGPCTSYWDCVAGAYCVPASDGGPGSHCAALSPEGGPCTDLFTSTDCTYKGTGAPPEYCAPVGDSGVCQPSLGLSEPCENDQWCLSGICDTAVTDECQNSTLFVGPPDSSTSLCSAYPFPDGGTD